MTSRVIHFVWYGPRFPFMNRLAISSALYHCPDFDVILWHSDPLDGEPDFQALRAYPRFDARRLDPEVLFGSSSELPFDSGRLRTIYREVRSHVSRSNLARAALCFSEGGIYLDIDVLVLRNLSPLLEYPCVLGTEHVVWPQEKVTARSPYRVITGPLLGRLRALCAALPRGEHFFDRVKDWYPVAVNGAIMAGHPRHPFFGYLLEQSSRVPKADWQRPHRLGTHVLQSSATEFARAGGRASGTLGGLSLLPPAAFFPLGPVVSRQYFRPRHDVADAIGRVIQPTTYLLHWYASVTALSSFGPERILRDQGRTIFGTLCADLWQRLQDSPPERPSP